MEEKEFKIWKLGKKLRKKLDRIELGYFWQDPEEEVASTHIK
jgi:hypothetical protein